MTPQLEAVFEISAIGTALLFVALAGLIGLMYLLTTQGLFSSGLATLPQAEEQATPTSAVGLIDDPDEEEEERERQRRAVVLAVAIACAQSERAPVVLAASASDWHRLHHSRRLSQPRTRARPRR
ncbi:MAG TPA: hypothetical protein DIU48_14505 [Acidobacteria bacterium]|mgnify:CR=1 FL=1|jgi:hypothetical protein|uniref:Uncharacterized protein n=1 Tax=marine metagenome TaxID=408172 RepID=A0A381NJB8_9ZZZZ|nr:hypothetical protein [Acidobacteriota bacterium]